MSHILPICFSLLLGILNTSFASIDKQAIDELPECIVVTHCVRQNWEVSDVMESFQKAVDAVANTPRTNIVEKTEFYIHAEAQTKWRRYTDDLLLKAFPERGLIQVRSESRVGIGDNGVNQKRIDELAYRLTTNQIN